MKYVDPTGTEGMDYSQGGAPVSYDNGISTTYNSTTTTTTNFDGSTTTVTHTNITEVTKNADGSTTTMTYNDTSISVYGYADLGDGVKSLNPQLVFSGSYTNINTETTGQPNNTPTNGGVRIAGFLSGMPNNGGGGGGQNILDRIGNGLSRAGNYFVNNLGNLGWKTLGTICIFGGIVLDVVGVGGNVVLPGGSLALCVAGTALAGIGMTLYINAANQADKSSGNSDGGGDPGKEVGNKWKNKESNPENWELTNEDVTPGKEKGTTNIEREYTNKHTNETLYEHEVRGPSGKTIHGPHPRGYAK